MESATILMPHKTSISEGSVFPYYYDTMYQYFILLQIYGNLRGLKEETKLSDKHFCDDSSCHDDL